jgi:preprotein translocase subunit SecB
MTNDAAPAAPQGRPQLRVNAQYVKDLSFENPGAPATMVQRQNAPEIGLDVNVDIRRVAERSFEVTLHIHAKAEDKGDTLFLVELAYAGVFSMEFQDEEQLNQILMMYCPNLLFPFARQIVASTTSQGGFPPLMLEPIDFSRLYAQHKAGDAEAAHA